MPIDDVEDGERVVSSSNKIIWVCCSCGLTHEHFYRVNEEGRFVIRVRDMNRTTGQVRRWMRKKREGIFGRDK